jgi:hypothetical protein
MLAIKIIGLPLKPRKEEAIVDLRVRIVEQMIRVPGVAGKTDVAVFVLHDDCSPSNPRILVEIAVPAELEVNTGLLAQRLSAVIESSFDVLCIIRVHFYRPECHPATS